MTKRRLKYDDNIFTALRICACTRYIVHGLMPSITRIIFCKIIKEHWAPMMTYPTSLLLLALGNFHFPSSTLYEFSCPEISFNAFCEIYGILFSRISFSQTNSDSITCKSYVKFYDQFSVRSDNEAAINCSRRLLLAACFIDTAESNRVLSQTILVTAESVRITSPRSAQLLSGVCAHLIMQFCSRFE
jgi:hypothetical protein